MEAVFTRSVFRRARRLCLALPDTTETSSWGHPNFRAGGKIYCTFEMVKGRPSFAFRLPPGEIDRVLASGQGFATPYGRGRWVSVWVDGPVDWPMIQSFMESSYRSVARKRMLAILDSGRRH